MRPGCLSPALGNTVCTRCLFCLFSSILVHFTCFLFCDACLACLHISPSVVLKGEIDTQTRATILPYCEGGEPILWSYSMCFDQEAWLDAITLLVQVMRCMFGSTLDGGEMEVRPGLLFIRPLFPLCKYCLSLSVEYPLAWPALKLPW